MKNNVPEDLVKYEKKKKIFTVLYYIFLLAVVYFSAYFTVRFTSGGKIERTLLNVFFCALFLVLVYLLSRKLLSRFIPGKIFDKTYFGIIKKVNVKTRKTSVTPELPNVKEGFNNSNNWDLEYLVNLDVLCEDGRMTSTTVTAKNCTVESLEKYEEGLEVFHLYGSKNVVIMPAKDSVYVNCPVCDTLNKTDNEICDHCRHSLIKRRATENREVNL